LPLDPGYCTTITGTVTTSNGTPVADATVSVAGCKTTTVGNGEFTIEEAPRGQYSLEITVGELILPIAAEVVVGETTKLSFIIDADVPSLMVGIFLKLLFYDNCTK
jgi:hypothetical protein